VLEEFRDAGQQFLDRPRKDQPHTCGAMTKPNQVFLGAMHVIVVTIPIGHDAIEHPGPQVEGNARY
jgi:hypothetical protein